MTATAQSKQETDLLDLYQQLILDHFKNPRYPGRVESPTHQADGRNPLCGDKVHVSAVVGESGDIDELRADPKGCAISVAAASLMTELLNGKSQEEADAAFEVVKDLLTGKLSPDDLPPEMADLAPLCGVAKFPSRRKCATLPWQTLVTALNGGDTATTETTEHIELA